MSAAGIGYIGDPMRPAVLFPLFADVTSLPGIGPRFGKLIAKLAGPKVADLLWHRPFGLIDRRFQPSVASIDLACSCCAASPSLTTSFNRSRAPSLSPISS